MAEADDIIAERLNRIENIPDRFINKVGATQQQLFSELLIILEQLGLSNEGTLTLSAANLNRVDQLLKEYYQVIQRGEYGALVSGFIKQMDEQKALNDEFFKLEFDSSPAAQSLAVYNQSRQVA